MQYAMALLAGAALGTAAPAIANPISVKPIIDTRLRYEHVDQQGFGDNADALTARLRAGAEFSSGDWTLLAEGESTLALHERYDSGLNGKTRYPTVADPENIGLNRFQLQYRGLAGTLITAGRQRINLDDQRFVGSSGWRDNEQTFDAARVETVIVKNLKADLTYAWSVRTIWGIDGKGARPQAIGGNNMFANLVYNTPYGKLTGFAYLIDQDQAAVQSFRLSSQTYGLRFAGSRPLSAKARLNYTASYARQSDFHRNPNDYAADYYALEAGLDVAALKLGLGYEVLGADDGRPLTSVQTPLATLHKFQGWADKFLLTPPNGLRDLYASGGYGWKSVAGLEAINAVVVYHRLDSDRLGITYGSEWDAMVAAKRGHWTATAKLADYRAKGFATDTRKIWLMLEWAY
ncbi:MAG: alginate export family protein [Sphingomicrobium sp.]